MRLRIGNYTYPNTHTHKMLALWFLQFGWGFEEQERMCYENRKVRCLTSHTLPAITDVSLFLLFVPIALLI